MTDLIKKEILLTYEQVQTLCGLILKTSRKVRDKERCRDDICTTVRGFRVVRKVVRGDVDAIFRVEDSSRETQDTLDRTSRSRGALGRESVTCGGATRGGGVGAVCVCDERRGVSRGESL